MHMSGGNIPYKLTYVRHLDYVERIIRAAAAPSLTALSVSTARQPTRHHTKHILFCLQHVCFDN